MPSSKTVVDERVENLQVTDTTLTFSLKDGREITVPLHWYPKLMEANEKQRSYWVLCCSGYGVHWPYIDEDLSSRGLLAGVPAKDANYCRISDSISGPYV